MASYKEEHEQFVSGHNGTTVAEVAVMTLTPCASLLLRDVLLLVYGLHNLPFWFVFIFSPFSFVEGPHSRSSLFCRCRGVCIKEEGGGVLVRAATASCDSSFQLLYGSSEK